MKKYNYLENIKEDIREYLKEENMETCDFDELYEKLFIEDSVTGNASGSYTFNTNKAKEYVMDNLDLLKKACEEFGCSDILGDKICNEDFEWCDVTIRCYLLGEVLNNVLDELK